MAVTQRKIHVATSRQAQLIEDSTVILLRVILLLILLSNTMNLTYKQNIKDWLIYRLNLSNLHKWQQECRLGQTPTPAPTLFL